MYELYYGDTKFSDVSREGSHLYYTTSQLPHSLVSFFTEFAMYKNGMVYSYKSSC